MTNEEFLIVKTTRGGLIMNILSLLSGIQKKEQFIISIIRGFAANFQLEKRIELASYVFEVC